MPEPSALLAFSLATLVLLLLPGPAVLYIITRTATQGRRAGLASVLGIHLGTAVHVLAAVVGLSALVAASAAAFTVIKLAGAGYLVWMGVRALRSARHDGGVASDGGPPVSVQPLRRVVRDGVVVNVLNPKVAVFFLSFVPQFVDPAAGSAALQLVVLGGLFVALGLVSDGLYCVLAGFIGARLRSSASLRRRKDLVAGGVYLGLGTLTALGGGE